MKKLFIILAILLIAGIANAANIPTAVAPEVGGEKWLMQVYNNSSSALDAGDVVIWDIDASTGDDYMYVNTTTTVGTGPIAGVANEAIAAKSVGSIVVYGLTDVDTDSGVSALTPMGTGASVGDARHRSVTAATIYLLGYSVSATASGSTPVFVNPQSDSR